MHQKTRYTIIGAGNGGQSFAGHLSLLGFPVKLWDVEREKVDSLKRTHRIRLSGAVEGEGTIPIISGTMRNERGIAPIMISTDVRYNNHDFLLVVWPRLLASVRSLYCLMASADATVSAT